MKLRALVVDDEVPARKELCYILEELGIEVVRSVGNAEDTLQAVKDTSPDIVFLDIELHDEINGLEVAAGLFRMEMTPIIVFATAYDKYAVKAFELNAVDYLLKPFDKDRIKKTIERIKDRGYNKNQLASKLHQLMDRLQNGESEKKKSLKIPTIINGSIIPLDQSDIIFAWAEGRTAHVKTFEREYNTNYSFGDLVEKLDSENFIRTHRSYCVNIDGIKEVQPMFKGVYNLIMADKDNSQVPVSRNYAKKLKEHLGL